MSLVGAVGGLSPRIDPGPWFIGPPLELCYMHDRMMSCLARKSTRSRSLDSDNTSQCTSSHTTFLNTVLFGQDGDRIGCKEEACRLRWQWLPWQSNLQSCRSS